MKAVLKTTEDVNIKDSLLADFIHLHTHSDYSLLKSAASIPNLVTRAKELGMEHLALTDCGNMFGSLRFYKACKAAGINPIVGCELYLTPGFKPIRKGIEDQNRYCSIVLLAKNQEGYRNLIQLASRGYHDGFHYKSRVDMEFLTKYSNGIIALSSGLTGEIPRLILKGKKEKARTKSLEFLDIFGEDNFYLEIQNHGIPEEKEISEALIQISMDTGIAIVATNDILYTRKEDANAHAILTCIGTNRKWDKNHRKHSGYSEYYMKTQTEMGEIFRNNPEALRNSFRIAEKCNLMIDQTSRPLLPDFTIPHGFGTPDDYLRDLTQKGLKNRYYQVAEKARKRADYELDIIISLGFTNYFLIVWDIIHWAQRHNIPTGPGRGFSAGSIVAYALRITDIDPFKYNLFFERFLNPEHVSIPNFVLDFCFERRHEVIDYVIRKYGKEKVGSISTFGTYWFKEILVDAAKIMGIPFAKLKPILKLIPTNPGIKLQEAIDKEPKLKKIETQGGVLSELIDAGKRLEGLNCHRSTHAACLVISKEDLTEYVPICIDPKTSLYATQYSMDQLEECGFVKFYFLGLTTLTLINEIEQLIRKRDSKFDIRKIPEDDKETFLLLGKGKSDDIFQFESSRVQKKLKQAKPDSIEDLIALNALYRPGPWDLIDQFINAKQGKIPIEYHLTELKPILKETYGIIAYQEQIMEIANKVAGFSMGQADIMRLALARQETEVMVKQKANFIQGAFAQGYSKKVSEQIFKLLISFSRYSFPKSHAAAYTLLSYRTAYLKANYPIEFSKATRSTKSIIPMILWNKIWHPGSRTENKP